MSAVEVTQAMVDFYHVHGAVKLPGLISREEAAAYREVAMELLLAGPTGELDIDGANQQRVQVWKWNETLRGLTMLPRLGAAAERLAGMPLRLWHDDIIAKPPHNEGPTRPHQDMPLWPLGNAPGALTAWIALQDTSIEMGCMSFAMGSQQLDGPARRRWPTATAPMSPRARCRAWRKSRGCRASPSRWRRAIARFTTATPSTWRGRISPRSGAWPIER